MSEVRKCETIDKLLDAVKDFVKAPSHTPGSFVGFKVQVFLGRGVHEFVLNDEESKALREVARLKKMLEKAEQKLQTARDSGVNKRARTSSDTRSNPPDWPLRNPYDYDDLIEEVTK